MAVNIPQVITPDKASGAEVIDGCLRFDTNKGQYLKFTPSSSGNRRTQTLSVWIKNTYNGSDNKVILGGGDNASGPRHNIYYTPTKRFGITQNPTGSQNDSAATVGQFRDFSGWQHLVMSLDCTVGQNSGQVRIYVNGKLQENGDYAGGGSAAYITDQDGIFNTISKRMYLGHYAANPSDPAEFDGYMAQYYWIDGLALGPKYFGYTDPLTGTWRPKKFRAEGTTLNDGTDWSSSTTNLTNGDNGFNGNLGNYAEVSSSGAKGTVTFPKSIKVENSVTFWYSSGQAGNLFINDETTAMEVTGSLHQQDIEFTGTLSSVSIQSGSQPAIWGIAVDGTILESSVTQNLDFGTNGVYLPFDGSAPIGQDQSGKGNDYTPVNFGGSASIEKATGAKPILNTINGGTVARAGVFGGDVSKTYAVTVASVDGGNRYHFDGVDRPNPTLVRGATYTFDQSDSSNGSGGTHPLRFATAADAAGSSQYTDGVATNGTPGQAGAYTKITVPHNAPDTLYYYCTNHGGMGSSTVQITDETKADPFAWKCVLALPLVGTDDDGRSDLSNSINCTSTTKTTAANNTVGSNAQSNFYGGSFYFDGTDDYLECGNSSDYDMDGDFTAEAWVYPTAHTNDYAGIFGFSYDTEGKGWNLLVRSSTGRLHINVDMNYTDVTHSLPLNKWTHLALVRSGTGSGNCKLYIDGVADPTTITDSDTTQTPSGAQCLIGSYPGYASSREFTGYIQDARIYKGVAKYTRNFIPAATNPDILPDSPSGVATKSKLTTITDGAVSFDGTGDEVTVSGHSDLTFGTGNFTIDCFAYFNSFDDTYPTVLSKLVGSTLSWIVRVKNNGKVVWYSKNGGGTNNESSSEPIVLRKWHHIAVVREGTGANQLKVYVDGTVALTMTDSNDYDDTSALCIGTQETGGGNTINGFISNVRIVNGTALYTGNFAPPARKLENVTNTKLLCCQSPTSAGVAAVSPNLGGINDGRVWSDASNLASPGLLFDGNDDTYVNSSTTSGGNLITAATQFTVPEGQALTIRTQNGGASNISVNGSNVSVNSGNVVTTLVTGGAGGTVVTSITAPTGYNLYYLKLNGVSLMDPVAPVGDAAATNFNPFNTDINTVRGQESGYATFNPLQKNSGVTLSNGNLKLQTGSNAWKATQTTIGMKTGKFYWEFGPQLWRDNNNHCQPGVAAMGLGNAYEMGGTNYTAFYHYTGTTFFNGQGGAGTAFGQAWNDTEFNIIGIAFDADTRKVWFSRNGVWQGNGNPSAGTNEAGIINLYGDGTYAPTLGSYGSLNGGGADANFGQKPFKFPPPDGFQPLTSSTARPDTVVARSDKYFNTVLYTGNGASSPGGSGGTQFINTGVKPDLIWIKDLTQSHNHNWYDTTRGEGSILMSDSDSGNITNSTDAVTFIGDTGFRLGDNGEGTQSLELNKNGNSYVCWNWYAGGSSANFNKDGVGYSSAADVPGLAANTASVTTNKCSIGTKQGFSIINYTLSAGSQSIGHGLDQVPEVSLAKCIDAQTDWYFRIKTLDGVLNGYIILNGTAGITGSFSPTATQVSAAYTSGTQNWIAYNWHSVPGFLKIGTFAGNNNNDGPYVDLGFKPAMLIVKRHDGSGDWVLWDNKRNPSNPVNRQVWPYTSSGTYGAYDQVGSNYPIDFLSNGFKMRSNDADINGSAGYFYMAWAETPSFNLFGATANAR